MIHVRIVGDRVLEIIPKEATVPSVEHWYGEEFASQVVKAPDHVQANWFFVDGEFYEEDPRPQPPVPINPLEEMQKTIAAQSAIIAFSVGAEIELTPEIIELATAGVQITELEDEGEWRVGVRVKAGTHTHYGGVRYRCKQQHITQADWTPDRTPALWVVAQEEKPGEVLPWVAGEAVSAGYLRSFENVVFEVIQPHTTQAGWEPPNVPALWRVKETETTRKKAKV